MAPPRSAVGNPPRDELRDAHGLIDDVAHEPVHRTPRPKAKGILAQMRDQSIVANCALQRAVVDGDDEDAALHELPGPAPRCGTQIDRPHARAQKRGFTIAEEDVDRFSELERGARRRTRRHAQSRDAHRPVVGVGAALADPGGRALGQKHVQALVRAVVQRAVRLQLAVDAHGERAREPGQRLAFVGVRELDPHGAPRRLRSLGDCREDRRDPIGAALRRR
jgi:hypothetical protein